ncbi:MAG: 3-phosphoshikimate 1-carboxyvinyltransferase [Lachnospiraceae bacterium]|nr:3-phosphoshikimate 1-carboxyvinyltransferase [Lachnospiraceae bacterium]
MKVIIEPGKLSGHVRAISSKSQAHRVLFCAAFADRETLIRGLVRSDDIDATIRACEVLGADVNEGLEGITIVPVDRDNPRKRVYYSRGQMTNVRTIDIGESGTTLRFILPLLGIDGEMTEIQMHGRLSQRPMKELLRELAKKGMDSDQLGYALRTQNKLLHGAYRLPGNVSSQFISSLLIALPLLTRGSTLEITGDLSSSGYVDMTLDVLRMFGADIVLDDHVFVIHPIGTYRSPGEISIEGDWSAAACWIAARSLGSDVMVEGLSDASYQPDRAVNTLLRQIMAGDAEIDIDTCPDLLPVLAVAAAGADGYTRFVNAARLRMKESDRIDSTANMIRALGGVCETDADSLTVTGRADGLTGGTVETFGDHRIAMSAAIASTICREQVTINGAEAVTKSYPDFWKELSECTTQLVTITD